MPTAPTIKNRHQGYAEWLARATAHYAAMTTAALAARLRDRAGLHTSWDNDERGVIYAVLERRHPEILAAIKAAYLATHLAVDVTAVELAAINALPAAELERTGGQPITKSETST